MTNNFYKDICLKIKGLGFQYWKQAKGSHEKWRHHKTGLVLIVPKNLKSRHTANDILKDAGGTKKF